jgi:aromatic ring-opening dioxygenase LigB subunit
MIVFAGIAPHPPLVVPGIGKDDAKKVKATREAYEKFAADLAETEPDVIIVISPHMVHYPHLFNVSGMKKLYGSFESYGMSDFDWHGHNDTKLAGEIVDTAEDADLPSIYYDNGETEYELDHGVMVPLYFIKEKMEHSFKVLPIGYSNATRAEHFSFGQVISEVCDQKGQERIALVASGDLSHRLLEVAPAGTTYTGKEFDAEIVRAVKKGDEYSLVNIDENILENAGECAYRSILIMLGAITGRECAPKVYSYEAPFGVGYLVANMGLK